MPSTPVWMRLRALRSLLAQALLWIVLPLSLLMFGLLLTGAFIYEQVVTSLVLDRDRQLAVLAAATIDKELLGYARVLETMASQSAILNLTAKEQREVLEEAADTLELFDAGVGILDRAGNLTAVGNSTPLDSRQAVEIAAVLRARPGPAYSDVLSVPGTDQEFIVVAVPLVNEANIFQGALLGGINLHTSALGDSVRRLVIGEGGFAYLVDRQGRVVVHPKVDEIGLDYRERAFAEAVNTDRSGGVVWTRPDGVQLVEGYAPVPSAGWHLVVQEQWSLVIAPIQRYEILVLLSGLAALFISSLLLAVGVQRIVEPIRLLANQTTRLASGEPVPPLDVAGILEIESLVAAFNRMVEQIASYRAGLRRYLEAITNSQEEERRRIAQELHDETAQNLLAISRRLEFAQSAETEPARAQELEEIRQAVSDSLRGVREISSDLRPLMLEDLGLVPALQVLVRQLRRGPGAVPHADFVVLGQAPTLTPAQELALYRITQEALNNIRKHARATGVQVTLASEPDRVRLEIGDDGAGFDVPVALTDLAQQGSFGLLGIQERVWAMGGVFSISSARGEGTRLLVVLPKS